MTSILEMFRRQKHDYKRIFERRERPGMGVSQQDREAIRKESHEEVYPESSCTQE